MLHHTFDMVEQLTSLDAVKCVSSMPALARMLSWSLCASLLMSGLTTHVLAQSASGTLTGIIRDQAGGAVPGATVTVTEVSANASRTLVSTSDGIYSAVGLTPGDYRVDVELSGFRSLRREGVRVTIGERVRLDLVLAVGDVHEQVTVTADAPVLRQETASLGAIVDHTKVVQLPLNGRSFVKLAALAPGVALPPGSQLPRINGGRPRTNEYLFDGISVLQPEPGQVAFFPVIDAIQEFNIVSNSAPAEFGRFNGGVVNLTTKAGSNVFHGDGFEFLRNELLNARNFFASMNPIRPHFRRHQFGGTLGGPIEQDHTFFFADYQGQRQTIGRTVISTVPTLLQRQGIFTEPIGGCVPVIYDPATTAPTPGGGFTRTPFSSNTIPLGRMDAVALALLQRYPLPTLSGTANNYQRTANETDNQDQWDVRLDHRFRTNRDQAFGRLSYFHEGVVPVTPLPDGSGVTSGTLGPQNITSWAFASNYQHTFADRWVNELRLGDTRRAVTRAATQLASAASSTLNLPGIPSSAQFPNTLPTFLISGYQQLGSPPSTASDSSTGVTEVADALTWLKGKGRHTVKIGLDWRWERLNVIQPASPTGSFAFSSLFTDLPGVAQTGTPLASFLLGQVQTFSIDLQQQEIRNRAHIQEYFVQDDWKVSDRLTIMPGVRYTLNFPSIEEHNQAAVFNLQTQQLDYLGRDGNPRSARRLHKLNFGPRLGLVDRLTDKTILSSGYGLIWIEQAGITTPFTTPHFPFLQTVSQRTLDNINPAFLLANGPSVTPIPLTLAAGLGQGVFAVDADLGSGYVQQWNASLQHELTTNTSVELSYVGSQIVHVGIPDSNLNQLSVNQLAVGSALMQRVPNPYFGLIPPSSSLGDQTIPRAQLLKPYPAYATVSLYRNNVGTTFYQGLEARLQQRFAHGLTYLVSYTRSKLVDDASAVFDASILSGPTANTIADSFNRNGERDYSNGDLPHVFVSSLVWDVPAGAGGPRQFHGLIGALANDWTITTLVTIQSGMPIAVTQATNFNSFAGFGTQRPNLVGDPRLPVSQRTPSAWFNTAPFAVAPQFTLGTASRNPVRGPSYRDVDLALIRRVPLRGEKALEARIEIFNLLNTPPLGAPNGVFGTPGFGTITSAGDPRVIQLAMKLLF